jgi:hypothetical protein
MVTLRSATHILNENNRVVRHKQSFNGVAIGRDECTLIAACGVKKEIPAKEYPIMARSKFASGSKRKDESVSNNAALVPPVTAEAVTEPVPGNEAEASKLQGMKTDSRASVVPINLEDEIRRRAYKLSQHRGFAPGHETEDWLRAENEVLQRYRQ